MPERMYTLEECENQLTKLEAEVLVYRTFKNVIERGDFVLIDDSGIEPKFKIVKAKNKKH